MTPKMWLQRGLFIEIKINAKLEQIHRLRDMATSITTTLSPDKVIGSNTGDRTAKCIERIVDLEREIDSEIDVLVNIKREISELISQIDDDGIKTLLELRYINMWRWEKIADRMNYSWRSVHYVHNKALDKVCTLLHIEE